MWPPVPQTMVFSWKIYFHNGIPLYKVYWTTTETYPPDNLQIQTKHAAYYSAHFISALCWDWTTTCGSKRQLPTISTFMKTINIDDFSKRSKTKLAIKEISPVAPLVTKFFLMLCIIYNMVAYVGYFGIMDLLKLVCCWFFDRRIFLCVFYWEHSWLIQIIIKTFITIVFVSL